VHSGSHCARRAIGSRNGSASASVALAASQRRSRRPGCALDPLSSLAAIDAGTDTAAATSSICRGLAAAFFGNGSASAGVHLASIGQCSRSGQVPPIPPPTAWPPSSIDGGEPISSDRRCLRVLVRPPCLSCDRHRFGSMTFAALPRGPHFFVQPIEPESRIAKYMPVDAYQPRVHCGQVLPARWRGRSTFAFPFRFFNDCSHERQTLGAFRAASLSLRISLAGWPSTPSGRAPLLGRFFSPLKLQSGQPSLHVRVSPSRHREPHGSTA
jgi:hypothetical protein